MADYIDRKRLLRDPYIREGRYSCSDLIRMAINEQPTADVVPRSEVEKLQKKLNDYKKFIGEIRVTSDNHAVIIESENTEYIDKRVAEAFKNMAVKQAKQAVAKQVIDEFKAMVVDYVQDKDLLLVTFKNAVAYAEAELKKKYIGKDTDVPTNIGE